MYAAETMTREEFRRARREQLLKEQRTRRRRAAVFCLTLVIMFGVGVCFGSILARAEEPAQEEVYKYYANIRLESGDTLWEIAGQYMDDVHYAGRKEYISEVMRINHLVNGHLVAGQKIIVPYYSMEIK